MSCWRLLSAAELGHADNPVDAVADSFSEERFLQVLDAAKHDQAKALAAHCASVRKMRASQMDAVESNIKFATQAGVFEGA